MGDSVTKHTTPLPRADQASQSGQADKPDRRASRFDQRGIALQTVIIMVVLLAIAGGVAAVLLSRGSETTAQLEAQGVSAVVAKNINSEALCRAASGVKWVNGQDAGEGCQYRDEPECQKAGGTKAGRNCNDKDGNRLGRIAT